jgi:hypothetical protein
VREPRDGFRWTFNLCVEEHLLSSFFLWQGRRRSNGPFSFSTLRVAVAVALQKDIVTHISTFMTARLQRNANDS